MVGGTEQVSYVAGTVPSGGVCPLSLWRDKTLKLVARLIRRFHDASTSFRVQQGFRWQPIDSYPGGGRVICHNDLAPWNTVFRDEEPVAFIDWDMAAPGPRLWDVVYALWHFVPLYGDTARPFHPLLGLTRPAIPLTWTSSSRGRAVPVCSAMPTGWATAARWWPC